jgi:hypothetical protein
MYITDITHLLKASAKMPEDMPYEARDFIGFLTQVIVTTTKTLPHSLTTTDVICFKKGCSGRLRRHLDLILKKFFGIVQIAKSMV